MQIITHSNSWYHPGQTPSRQTSGCLPFVSAWLEMTAAMSVYAAAVRWTWSSSLQMESSALLLISARSSAWPKPGLA